MLKNKLSLFIFSVMLISSISANLIISPTTQEVSVKVGELKNYTINIQNNNSFDIYDVSFPELEEKGFIFPDIDIPENSSKQITYQVNTSESFFGQIYSKVQYKFYVDLPEEIQTYEIKVSDLGFNPGYKTIRKGDTIRWNNSDDISHEIFSDTFGTISIPPGETRDYTFNSLGYFNYYDLDFNIFNEFNGAIEVINRTDEQLAHNPFYDETWIVTLSSLAELTNISITNSLSNFQIDYGSSKKGLITITNTGLFKAEKVKLTSNSTWVGFNKNNFDINPEDPSGVEYTISPYVSNTNQTNRSYQISISIKALNTNQKNLLINVFVPYKEISEDLNSDLAYQQYLDNVYCPKYPCSLFCHPELPQCSSNSSNPYGTGTLTLNVTTQDWYETKKEISTLRDLTSRILNKQQTDSEEDNKKDNQFNQTTSESLEIQKELLKQAKQRRTIITVLSLSIVIALCIVFVAIRLRRQSIIKDRVKDIHIHQNR